MTYELAKKLKESGFPFRTIHLVREFAGDQPYVDNEHPLMPTLSELVEACSPLRSDDFGLRLRSDSWAVHYMYVGYFEHNEKFKDKIDGTFIVNLNIEGETPEEAVANLWLALNKK